jgi:phosphoketolase
MTNQAARQKASGTTARESTPNKRLTADLSSRIDAYWRAANYLSVGQIYLFDNPLQANFQTPALQDLEKGDPVNSCRFHGHRFD